MYIQGTFVLLGLPSGIRFHLRWYPRKLCANPIDVQYNDSPRRSTFRKRYGDGVIFGLLDTSHALSEKGYTALTV